MTPFTEFALCEYVFDNFAVTTTEVADYFGLSKQKVYDALRSSPIISGHIVNGRAQQTGPDNPGQPYEWQLTCGSYDEYGSFGELCADVGLAFSPQGALLAQAGKNH